MKGWRCRISEDKEWNSDGLFISTTVHAMGSDGDYSFWLAIGFLETLERDKGGQYDEMDCQSFCHAI